MSIFDEISQMIQKYAQTGERGDLDKISLELLKTAKHKDHANAGCSWYLKYDEIILEKETEFKRIEEKHKHYRGIAIGYTATIVTLSIAQIGFWNKFFLTPESVIYIGKYDVTEIGKAIPSSLLILAILLCVFAQFFIFRGYLFEARGDFHVANNRYFSPTDKIVRGILYLFLSGTAINLLFILGWWQSLLVILPIIWFSWRYYRGIF